MAITRQYLESLIDNPNVQKYLEVVSQAEGTAKNGYATAFGGGKLDNLTDHPRQLHAFQQTDGKSNKTSAAGRYQFLTKTWDGLKKQYGLQDFGARSQDIGALALIAQRGALNHVLKGDFTGAINKTGGIWASLPSSQYAQPKRSWDFVNKSLGQQPVALYQPKFLDDTQTAKLFPSQKKTVDYQPSFLSDEQAASLFSAPKANMSTPAYQPQFIGDDVAATLFPRG